MSAPRILSLLPSATEIVGALDLADHLVGVTHECDACPDAAGMARALAAGVRRVTISHIDPHQMTQGAIDAAVKQSLASGLSLYALDEPLVRAARPSVVLTQALCAVCAPSADEVAEVCQRLGAALADEQGREPEVLNLEPTTLAEVGATFEAVAAACGVPDRGAALRAAFDAKFTRLAAATEGGRRPRVLLLEWLDPPFDGGHWVPEQVTAAGGVPAMNVPGGKSTGHSWDEVEAADPDVVVVACCGFDLDRNRADAAALLASDGEAGRRFRALRAVRAGRAYALDGNRYFARPAPSLAEGAAALARCAHDRNDRVVAALEALDFLPEQGVGWERLIPPIGATASPRASGSTGPGACDMPDAWAVHEEACREGHSTYPDPATGFRVMTRVALEARGRCCGCGCRHCPYGHENVEDKVARIQQPAFLHRRAGARGPCRVLFWSGGKDSLLALRALLRGGDASADSLVLLTTFDAQTRALPHQRVPLAAVLRQAEALDLPLVGVPLQPGRDYLVQLEEGLARVEADGREVEALVFGDLHLEEVRAWRDAGLAGWRVEYPLWQVPQDQLLDDLEASGVPCSLSACPGKPGAEAVEGVEVGALFDAGLAARARAGGWDGFGEEGEFHTLAQVWEAPVGQVLGTEV